MSYASTIFFRKEDVTRADFVDSPRIQVGENRLSGKYISGRDLAVWNRHLPLKPQDISTIMALEDLHSAIPLLLETQFNHMMYKAIFYHLYPKSDKDLYLASSSVCHERESAEGKIDASIKLTPDLQGSGIGRKWFRSVIELGAALGYSHHDVFASRENGGYTWARAGVPLSPAIFEKNQNTPSIKTREALSDYICINLHMLEPILTRSVVDEVSCLARIEKQDALVKIANMDVFVDARFLGIEKNLMPQPDKTDKQKQRERGIRLGRLLLAGTHWTGRVDFSNDLEMEKIGRYCGGWKTLVQKDAVCPTYRP